MTGSIKRTELIARLQKLLNKADTYATAFETVAYAYMSLVSGKSAVLTEALDALDHNHQMMRGFVTQRFGDLKSQIKVTPPRQGEVATDAIKLADQAASPTDSPAEPKPTAPSSSDH